MHFEKRASCYFFPCGESRSVGQGVTDRNTTKGTDVNIEAANRYLAQTVLFDSHVDLFNRAQEEAAYFADRRAMSEWDRLEEEFNDEYYGYSGWVPEADHGQEDTASFAAEEAYEAEKWAAETCDQLEARSHHVHPYVDGKGDGLYWGSLAYLWPAEMENPF